MDMEKLRKALAYDANTGVWTHRGPKAGSIASYSGQDGYNFVRFAGKTYRAARLAFYYMEGRWPTPLVDHKNRIKGDDRWDNLRETSRSENGKNADQHLPGTKRMPPGFGDGVYFRADRNKWRARVRIGNRQRLSLGCFSTQEEAQAAYDAYWATHVSDAG